MKRARGLILGTLVLTMTSSIDVGRCGEPDLRSQMEKRNFRDAQGGCLPYRLFVPRNYDAKNKYPIIVFLHGAGERGADNEAQLKHAEVLRFVGDEAAAKQPCFLVAPQCPEGDTWAGLRLDRPYQTEKEPTKAMKLAMEMLDSLEKEFSIDPARRHVTGLSMGGFGTFDLCTRRPDAFAAAIPICGGGDAAKAKDLTKIAFWVFHGGSDDVVRPEFSHSIVEALKKAGADVKYTEYPGVGHHSWTPAYQEPKLVDWLLQQRRTDRK